jgi:HD superfamily phosphodiesterase
MNWSEFIETLFKLAEPYFAVRDDRSHAQVAHQYCLLLLEKEGGDRRIVEPAVILHDVGWSQLTPEQIKGAFGVRASGEEAKQMNRIHEIEGAVIAGRLLETLDYDTLFIKQITGMIEHHDSGNDPASLEEKILKDSDRLWRYSPFGFWKERERQGLSPLELYRHLEGRRLSWFFTETALSLSERELENRAKEIAEQQI